MVDEGHEQLAADGEEHGGAAAPMPLSMPPFAPRPPRPPVAAGPMPLSMPPMAGDDGGSLPPPPAPGPLAPPSPPPRAATSGASRRRLAAALLVTALLAGGLGAGLGASFGGGSANPARMAPLAALPQRAALAPNGLSSVGRVAAAVEPAVVDIVTTIASEIGGGREGGAGTGMIVTPTGQVLTNNHVVENATTIRVAITGRSGSYGATVLGVDPTKDLALLQLDGVSGRLPYVTLGNSSSVTIGETVVAIGNALGFGGQPSVVSGDVSALDRTITASDETSPSATETLKGLIETDADIVSGDSGGPLVNLSGQVIGVDTANASADGGATLGFAIPINEAKATAVSIESGHAVGGIVLGTSPFLGVVGEASTGVGCPGAFGGAPGFGQLPGFGGSSECINASTPGVPIGAVIAGSPAAGAGLEAGDVVTALGGVRTRTFATLEKTVDAHRPGDRLSLTYVDVEGVSHTVSLSLAGLPK